MTQGLPKRCGAANPGWSCLSGGFPFALSFFLLAAYPAQAQTGKFNFTGLNGTIDAGYTGDFGNQSASDHGITLGGAAAISGSYYNPNFLSFNIQPFLNQSRENSNYQSLSNASGVTASTSIFGGSYYPGSISFTKDFNAEGNYNVPGVANYTSRGDSQALNIGWSENIPNLPSVTVGFVDGSNNYSLYGADGDLISGVRSISIQSTYRVAGFSFNGGYRDSDTNSQIPEILGQAAESTTADISTFTFGIGHSLPFNGSISAAASRSDIDEDYSGGTYKATMDTLNGGIGFAPIKNLNIGGNVNYTDNLAASLDQTIIAAGGEVGNGTQPGSRALTATGFGVYAIPSLHLTISGDDDYRQQSFSGLSLASNSQTGSIAYSNEFLGGFLNTTVAVTRTAVSSSNQALMGFMGMVNYTRNIKAWAVSGAFHYSENTETALINYTSSGYGYAGSVGRGIGRKNSHWSVSGSGSKSTLSNEPGAGTFSQSYVALLTTKWVGINGAYSRSNGNSILTSQGLVPVTEPLPVVAPSSVILYGGHAYSGGVGLTPFRGLIVTGGYSRALSDTEGDATSSNNRTSQINAYLQYQLRKIYLTAGFSKLTQSFSSNGNVPTMGASYYFGISRWFNFL